MTDELTCTFHWHEIRPQPFAGERLCGHFVTFTQYRLILTTGYTYFVISKDISLWSGTWKFCSGDKQLEHLTFCLSYKVFLHTQKLLYFTSFFFLTTEYFYVNSSYKKWMSFDSQHCPKESCLCYPIITCKWISLKESAVSKDVRRLYLFFSAG